MHNRGKCDLLDFIVDAECTRQGATKTRKNKIIALRSTLSGFVAVCKWGDVAGLTQATKEELINEYTRFIEHPDTKPQARRNTSVLRCVFQARGLPYQQGILRRVRSSYLRHSPKGHRRRTDHVNPWVEVKCIRGIYIRLDQFEEHIRSGGCERVNGDQPRIDVILQLIRLYRLAVQQQRGTRDHPPRMLQATATCVIDFAPELLRKWEGEDGGRRGSVMGVFSDMDGVTLCSDIQRAAQLHQWNEPMINSLRAFLWKCKTTSEMDPNGYFQSHLQHVSRAFMDRYPLLLELHNSGGLCKRLDGMHTVDPIGTDWLVTVLLSRLCTYRLGKIGQRIPERALYSLGRQLMTLLFTLNRVAEEECALSAGWILSQCTTRARLIDIAAKAVALENMDRYVSRSGTKKGRIGRSPPITTLDRITMVIRNACEAGVFQMFIPVKNPITRSEIVDRIAELERANPSLYRPACTVNAVRPVAILDLETVQRMLEACSNPMETLVMLLLSTTGLRTNAIHNIKVGDVYDRRFHVVHGLCNILEKNSHCRRVSLCERTKEAVLRYLDWVPRLKDVPTRDRLVCDWLFPGSRRPHMPYTSMCQHLCRRLCNRINIPCVHPHSFRVFIVTMCIKNGKSIDVISKWLGHRRTGVTFKHYYDIIDEPLTLEELMEIG